MRKSHKRAIVAGERKMIRLIYLLLTREQAYLEQQIDYAAISEKKNPPCAETGNSISSVGPAPRHAPAAASV